MTDIFVAIDRLVSPAMRSVFLQNTSLCGWQQHQQPICGNQRWADCEIFQS